MNSEPRACTACHVTKPVTEFYDLVQKGRHYKQSWCKRCISDRAAERRRQNPAQHWTYHRKSRLKTKFGITLADYDAILVSQSGVCAICKQDDPDGRSLAVDHDHATGQIRGLLCRACNTAIGLLAESIERLDAAQKYLASWQDVTNVA